MAAMTAAEPVEVSNAAGAPADDLALTEEVDGGTVSSFTVEIPTREMAINKPGITYDMDANAVESRAQYASTAAGKSVMSVRR